MSNITDEERKQLMAASKAHERFTSHWPGGYMGLFNHAKRADVKVSLVPLVDAATAIAPKLYGAG